MSARPSSFESSRALKELFHEQYEGWKRRNGGDLADLALKCGVSSAYLAHVRRYGRIPSRPVLILLAFNFGINGQKLFDAAGISERFPYQPDLTIAPPPTDESSLFSFKFDSERFTNVIRSIVRSEVRQRSPKDLLGNRPIRIGLNYHQFWLFGGETHPKAGNYRGLFPEFCKMLGIALQREVELLHVPFSDYIDSLVKGEIDLFGPTMMIPNLPAEILFTTPLYKLGVSAVFRNRPIAELPEMPVPKAFKQLQDESYKIAVTKNSLPHLLANTLLKRSDDTLVLCGSDEEALDRVTLRGIKRPVHLFMANSMTTYLAAKENEELSLIFHTRKTIIDMADGAVAVRPDWPELLPVINDAIRFLQTRGGLTARIEGLVEEGPPRDFIEVY